MTQNHIGKTVYIATAVPATNDAAGFEALAWTQIKGVQTLPQFGISHGMTDVADLQSGFTSGIKGAAQGVDTTAQFRTVASDTGQASAKTVAESQAGICSMKIGDGSGTDNALASGDPVEYAQGILHSYQPNQGSDTTHEGFSVGFRQNAVSIVATEPV